ncbi:ABC transporter permease [Arthrobacter psychrolactophilus]|uniref:ABC transporter permease n=1 Tax=Arthrobacter psychrolactophilus TaxID=92442 RepID=A0A2V5JEI5_9MICC|nr:carbohydrate ABC transporter permease [Arthrobacter psychrolactophilus]PYI37797.1 ABC transporter permease [Arthrobacter psychrolactophilus]
MSTLNPTPTQVRTGTRRASRRRTSVNIPVTLLIAVLSLTILIPLYFTIVTALKSSDQLGGNGLALPTSIHWENFSNAWQLTNFPHALLISGIVTVAAVILTILTNSLVAYAIARNMHRPFFKALYYFFIAALFVPFPIIMLPVTKEMAVLGLDNPVGLFLLYTVYGLSFNIFVYTAFIKSIPAELEEAAIMDGASVWTTYRKVIFPILTPINATVGILTCLWAWNDFLLPLVILSDPNTRTLPLVQYVFQGQFNTDYATAFASYLMAMAPLLLIYLFAQRWVISGVMRGSIK